MSKGGERAKKYILFETIISEIFMAVLAVMMFYVGNELQKEGTEDAHWFFISGIVMVIVMPIYGAYIYNKFFKD